RTAFANGMEVILLSKKTRGETVDLTMSLHFGDLQSLQGKSQVGDLTASMLMRGTTTRTREQIRDRLDELQATLRVYGGSSWLQASLETTRQNLGPAIEVMADVLRNPAFDVDEYRQLVEERLVGLEQSKTEPRNRSMVRLNRHLYPYPADDPRATLTAEEEIERIRAVDIAQVKEFFTTFYGASFGEVAVVGDFDPAQIESQLGSLFGDWNTPTPHERIVTDYQDRPALVERI